MMRSGRAGGRNTNESERWTVKHSQTAAFVSVFMPVNEPMNIKSLFSQTKVRMKLRYKDLFDVVLRYEQQTG